MPDMRFAPPNPLRIADRASGLNAVSVRSYNERLVLSLLLQSEAITRMEIGERTGLSAQTVSVLVRSLEQEGLVAKGQAQKGRMGPPTTPLSLNPDGTYSVGISVGKHIDVVLIDFVGNVRFHVTLPTPKAEAGTNHSQYVAAIRDAIAVLPATSNARLAGVGVALPHSYADGEIKQEYFIALQEEIEEQLGISVFVQNDVTAAASGESLFGVAKSLTDYMYFYLGAQLHGRLVLNHQIYRGNSPLSFDVGFDALERQVAESGMSTTSFWDGAESWPDHGEIFDAWSSQLVLQLKASLVGVSQFVEFKNVVLSSYAPHNVVQNICRKLQEEIDGMSFIAGSQMISPKAVGAASLPISSRFMVE